MNPLEILQIAASSLALVAGLLYIIGGMIVNIHLSKYRIIEYQLVSIHYLVVAVVFLLNLYGVLSIAFVPAAFLAGAIMVGVKWLIYVSAAITFLAVLALGGLLILSRRLSTPIKWLKVLTNILRVLIFVYPLSILLRIFYPPQPQTIDLPEQWIAYLIGGIVAVIFVVNYATEVYGTLPNDEADDLGGSIGRGVPQSVQLVCEKNDLQLLNKLGIPKADATLSGEIFLIGETNDHYIVTNDLGDEAEAIKIQKVIVRGLRYVNKKSSEPQKD